MKAPPLQLEPPQGLLELGKTGKPPALVMCRLPPGQHHTPRLLTGCHGFN